MLRLAPHSTLHTSTCSLPSTSPVLLSSSSPNPDLLSTYPITHCEDPRQDGTSTEFHSSTGCEPKRIELNRILVNPQKQITDDQDDIEEIGVKPLSYSHSMTHSAFDSAESIATPPDSALEDEQLRKMLASPLYFREREENEGQARAYHSERESLMIRSSRNPEVSGKPDAECVKKREANAQRTFRETRCSVSCQSQNTFSERDRSDEPGNRFESSVHYVFRFADLANVGKSLLDGNKDHLLNRNIKWDLSTVVSMCSSNKLMLKDWNWRTPITDILNLEENNFACKRKCLRRKKVLRDTQLRNIHEMEEMKRGQELRVDEFSVRYVPV